MPPTTPGGSTASSAGSDSPTPLEDHETCGWFYDGINARCSNDPVEVVEVPHCGHEVEVPVCEKHNRSWTGLVGNAFPAVVIVEVERKRFGNDSSYANHVTFRGEPGVFDLLGDDARSEIREYIRESFDLQNAPLGEKGIVTFTAPTEYEIGDLAMEEGTPIAEFQAQEALEALTSLPDMEDGRGAAEIRRACEQARDTLEGAVDDSSR